MFKKTLAIGAVALFTLTSTVFAASAASDVAPGNPPRWAPGSTSSAPRYNAPIDPSLAVADLTPLTEEEISALQFMREEEKLAHDVYITLYEKWDLRLFNNIARSEQQHTDAVAHLLERYDIDDPAADTGFGEFVNSDLQALYDDLIAQGSKSVEEALKVGAAIEEIDIMDLEERLADVTNAEVSRVFENLTFGSENHLRAFAMNIETQTGEAYAPQYMVQADYDEIVDADGPMGGAMGGRGAAGGRGGRGGRGF